jgi:hypothetical protein
MSSILCKEEVKLVQCVIGNTRQVSGTIDGITDQ